MRQKENKLKRRKIKGEKVGQKILKGRKIEKPPEVETGLVLAMEKTEGNEDLGGGREKRREGLKRFFVDLKRQSAERKEEVQKLLRGIRLQRIQRKTSITKARV